MINREAVLHIPAAVIRIRMRNAVSVFGFARQKET